MKKTLLKYQYQFFLFVIVIILFFTNYQPKTYLLGWDNLQTDLNPLLGIKRALFSVWEEYQSFGLLAGMAHATDLPRAIFIFILSLILPQNLIRYFYHFLMVLIGGLGTMKLFIDYGFCGNDKNNQKNNLTIQQFNNNLLSFIAALFYILNFGTVQIFFVPFEPFSTFFGFLPWLIWIFLKLINNSTIQQFNNLILFIIINFLAIPSFYTQQLFVVYILILGFIVLGKIFDNLNNFFLIKKYVLRSTLYVILIFIINSFWLLPQIYFLKTDSQVVYEAKASQLATEDVYFQNKEKGTLKYFLALEGFYFDLFDKNNQPLFASWKNHFRLLWPLQYFFAVLMILGVIYSIKKKNFVFVLPLFFIAVVFLNSTWPISLIDELLRQNKLYNQIFRSAFTKFIIPYSLIYSLFITNGLIFLISYFQKNKYVIRYTLYVILVIIFFYSLPSFQGFFISQEMKVKLPKSYFEVIDYFKKVDKNKRIALFPDYTFWGWFFTRWGLNSSGFLWYGIEQPIVSRTFDVWSEKSEGYFWEVKSAVESEDLNRLEAVFKKYDIDYLLIDYSLLPVVGSMKGLSYDRLENLFLKSKKIALVKKWQNLALYQFKNKSLNVNFIGFKNNLPNIYPKIKLTDFDNAFLKNGDYQALENKNPDIIYPFLDLTSQNQVLKNKWHFNEGENFFQIKYDGKIDLSQYQIKNFNKNFSGYFFENDQLASYSGNLSFQIKNNTLVVNFPKILLAEINHNDFYQTDCFPKTTCFSYFLPNLSQKYGYLLKIKTKNLKGRRLYFYILNQTKKQAFLEDRLKNDVEYYVLPPKYQYGLGYSITFHQNDYENLKSQNFIEAVEVYLFPYENLKSLKFTTNNFKENYHLDDDRIKIVQNDFNDFTAKKLAYFLYQIEIPSQQFNNSNNLTIYLSQSYHPGWKAYIIKHQTSNIKQFFHTYFPFIFGKELKDHVLVNNWANGWNFNNLTIKQLNNLTIYIIFWPQYLEFLGFGILILTLIYVLFFYRDSSYKKS